MGGHPYWYFVPHEPDVQCALERLREREFRAGRYNPVVAFPFDDQGATPGCGHGSIEEALEDSAEDGTRSILDISEIGTVEGFGVATPFGSDEIVAIFGSETPLPSQGQDRLDEVLEGIERGSARYVVFYE